jgi:hypothetical protein
MKKNAKERVKAIFIVLLKCLTGLFWMYYLSKYILVPLINNVWIRNDINLFTLENVYLAAFISWSIRKIILNWNSIMGKDAVKEE